MSRPTLRLLLIQSPEPWCCVEPEIFLYCQMLLGREVTPGLIIARHNFMSMSAGPSGPINTPLVMEALEFISRLILHIPDPQERMVTYYGPYANASKHRRSPAQSPDTGVGPEPVPEPEEPTPFERKLSVRWAQLIKQIWLEDPLLCPNCESSGFTPRQAFSYIQ